MKAVLLMIVMVLPALAQAGMLHCKVKGRNPHGIVGVSASELNGEVIVETLVRDAGGRERTLPVFKSKANLNEFRVADDFYNGPFGIQQAFIVKRGDHYALDSRTYCNFYYQEEKCLDGDIIELSTTPDLTCSN